MLKRLRAPRQQKPQPGRRTPDRYARPRLEGLEDRVVPTISYHGGPIIANVEVQGLYLGADWLTNANLAQEKVSLEGYLKYIVNSSYMDMLNKEGYTDTVGGGHTVGRGTFDVGVVDNIPTNGIKGGPAGMGNEVDDTQIQAYIQAAINSGLLKTPNSNTLYMVYVQDNCEVTAGGGNSVNDFAGYHSEFTNTGAGASVIQYAVMPNPDGVGPDGVNASNPWLSAVNSLTMVTSHELAEACTDPQVNGPNGWYNDSSGNEVGDGVAYNMVYLNGYAVQRISDKNDEAMTPAGSTGATQEDFYIDSSGNLYRHTSNGSILIATGVAKVSSVGIDFFGQTQVDYMTTNGHAVEYHDFNGNSYLTNAFGTANYTIDFGTGYTDAKAGQSVSYLLGINGTVTEYNQNNRFGFDGNGKGYSYTLSGVYTAIDAGTDQYGVSELAGIGTDANLYTLSDSTNTYSQDTNTGNVVQISAGWHGDVGYLTNSGGSFYFNVATSATNGTLITFGASGITVGTNTDGSSLIYLTGGSNQIATWSVANGFTLLPYSGVATIGKANNGVLDLVFTNSQVDTLDSSGLHYVAKGGSTAFGSVS